jgi:hypothetical protein
MPDQATDTFFQSRWLTIPGALDEATAPTPNRLSDDMLVLLLLGVIVLSGAAIIVAIRLLS